MTVRPWEGRPPKPRESRDCSRFRDWATSQPLEEIAALARDGAVAPAGSPSPLGDQRQAEEHLASCRECSRFLQELRFAKSGLRDHHTCLMADRAFASRVSEQLETGLTVALGTMAFKTLPAFAAILGLVWILGVRYIGERAARVPKGLSVVEMAPGGVTPTDPEAPIGLAGSPSPPSAAPSADVIAWLLESEPKGSLLETVVPGAVSPHSIEAPRTAPGPPQRERATSGRESRDDAATGAARPDGDGA